MPSRSMPSPKNDNDEEAIIAPDDEEPIAPGLGQGDSERVWPEVDEDETDVTPKRTNRSPDNRPEVASEASVLALLRYAGCDSATYAAGPALVAGADRKPEAGIVGADRSPEAGVASDRTKGRSRRSDHPEAAEVRDEEESVSSILVLLRYARCCGGDEADGHPPSVMREVSFDDDLVVDDNSLLSEDDDDFDAILTNEEEGFEIILGDFEWDDSASSVGKDGRDGGVEDGEENEEGRHEARANTSFSGSRSGLRADGHGTGKTAEKNVGMAAAKATRAPRGALRRKLTATLRSRNP